jgi:hypothetical protein
MLPPYRVAVVLESDFSDRLSELAARMPIWIVDTPVNRAAAEKEWAQHPSRSHTEGITTFKADPAASAEDRLSGVLSDLDLHHGEYSHDPAYNAIEVFGAALTPLLRKAFAAYGLDEFVERSGGFVASKVELRHSG